VCLAGHCRSTAIGCTRRLAHSAAIHRTPHPCGRLSGIRARDLGRERACSHHFPLTRGVLRIFRFWPLKRSHHDEGWAIIAAETLRSTFYRCHPCGVALAAAAPSTNRYGHVDENGCAHASGRNGAVVHGSAATAKARIIRRYDTSSMRERGGLGFAWEYKTTRLARMGATPLVVDGVMYTSGRPGVVYAAGCCHRTSPSGYSIAE